MREKVVYANPIVGRTGLGNMLFSWARAETFCRDHGAVMLAPQWVNVCRIGPWLRGERDKRYYLRNFSNEGMIRGLRRHLVLKSFHHVPESEYPPFVQSGGTSACVVDFRGMDRFFEPFLMDQPYVYNRLLAITSETILAPLRQLPEEIFIGVHIRRGDFLKGGIAIPDTWYVKAVTRAMRAIDASGTPLTIRVFSDAQPEAFQFLSDAFPLVTFMPKAPALQDLLHLSRCAALVGTSRSTFSMWAAFLGQMPSFWHPCEKPPPFSVLPCATVTMLDSCAVENGGKR